MLLCLMKYRYQGDLDLEPICSSVSHLTHKTFKESQNSCIVYFSPEGQKKNVCLKSLFLDFCRSTCFEHITHLE